VHASNCDRYCLQSHTVQGEVAFLLATDVAARGLDILGVETVVNFDCPTQLASYLHRCGGCGAAVLCTDARADCCSACGGAHALQHVVALLNAQGAGAADPAACYSSRQQASPLPWLHHSSHLQGGPHCTCWSQGPRADLH